MAWYRCGGGGIPSSLKSDMNDVFNKKFGTVLQDYPPEDWPGTVNLMGPLPERTVSGSVVAFSDGADDVPLKKCAVTIAPTLDGVSSVDVVQTKKNFVDDTLDGLEQGSISSGTGQNANSNTRVRTADYIPFPLDKIQPNYVLTIPNGYKIAMCFYDKDKNFVTPPAGAQGFINTIPSGYVGKGVEFARFILAKTDDSNITPNDMKNVGFQIEVGSTATAYAPYVQPTTHTAQLGRTIYGGSVDVVNGTGTKNSKMRLLSSLTWTVNPNYQHTYNGTGFTDRQTGIAWSNDTCKSDKYIGYSSYTVGGTPKGIALSNSGTNTTIYVSDEDCPTLQDFLDMLQNEDSKVTLPLATPEDFTFTPVPIISRLGDNTLWGDGDLSVTYRRDIDLALAQ